DGDRIRHLTHQSLALRDPEPLYRGGTGSYQRPIEEVDLLDPATWDRLSLYIQTRRELMIADFAPRLWSVLVALAGGEDVLARRTMGEQLILNGEFTTGPAPRMNSDYWSFYNWH